MIIFAVLAALPSKAEKAALPLSAQFSPEILRLGDLLDNSGYAEVLEKGEALLPQVRLAFPEGSVDEAKLLDFMVHACYRSSRVMDPIALTMGERAVSLKESLLGSQDPELANSLMHLGNLHSRRWEGEQAIPYYERAVAILEAAGPDFDDQRAIILNSEGVAYRRIANNLKALELYEEALAIQERVLGPQHPDVASTLNNQAMVYGERSDYRTAVRLHRRALAIREKAFGPDHEWVGESANNLASQLGYLGMYDEALEMQERAVRIFREQLGTDHQRYWFAKLNLGIAYLDMGDPEDALPICEEVVEGLRKRYGPDHSQTCYALDAQASSHFGLGQFEQALEVYTQSLKIAEAAYGVGSYETADTIQQQGKCLIALGRLDEAVERLNRSLSIWEESNGENHALLCEPLNRLAELYLQKKEYERVLATARRSSSISLRDLGESHPLYAASTLLEGKAKWGLGQNEAALDDALLTEDISHRHLQRTMRVLSEDRALDYAGSRVEGLNLALSLLSDGETGSRVVRVWDAVIHSRSVVLDEYTARNRSLNDRSDPMISALMDSSLALRERLANLTLRGPGWEEVSVYQGMLKDTEADLNAVERQLSLNSSNFRKMYEDPDLGFQGTSEALPAASALVGYIRCKGDDGRETYKVFTLSGPGRAPRVRNLGSAEEIDAAVNAWRDQATFGVKRVDPSNTDPALAVASRGFLKVARKPEDQLKAYNEAGANLRRLVWDPLQGDLEAGQAVFIVADGSLNLVSFPSLPMDDGRFLVEADYLLHLLVSEKAIAQGPAAQVRAGRLLAVGGPDYNAQAGEAKAVPASVSVAGGAILDGLRFSALPQSQAEIGLIRTIWSGEGGQVSLLSGAQATEENLKNSLPGTQVLHLATHGFFLPGKSVQTEGPYWDNPLVRSGLALAGANGRQQATSGNNDGILTATEISALDLTGVDWAVLSACDTGLGDLDARGEGVFGLRRVFTLAGARTVIMSLWSVEDESSRDWMKALYEARWKNGLSTAASVREASREILARRRAEGLSPHPFYWAGFVAAGDWR